MVALALKLLASMCSVDYESSQTWHCLCQVDERQTDDRWELRLWFTDELLVVGPRTLTGPPVAI